MSTAVVMLGNAVLGEWRSSASPRRPAMPAKERQVRQLRNELSRLAHLRITQDLATGEGTAWAIVLASTIAGFGNQVTGDAICAMASTFSLPPQNLTVARQIARDADTARRLWGASHYPLIDGETIAALLEVTAAEREEASLRGIGAVDETPADRKRRLARQRQAKRRLKGAGLKPATISPKLIWP